MFQYIFDTNLYQINKLDLLILLKKFIKINNLEYYLENNIIPDKLEFIIRDRQRAINTRIYEISRLLAHDNNPLDLNNGNYLDIGCDTGDISESIGKFLNIKNICGLDIKNNLKTNIEFKILDQNNIINYPDNYFSLITIFQVLHHIKPEYLDKLYSEIIRVLKKQGYLIIRDHDFNNNSELIILEHKLYNNNFPEIYLLKSESDWIKYFSGKFNLIYKKYNPKNNPTGYFMALFKLNN